MIESKTYEYIAAIGLQHLKWKSINDEPGDEIEHALLIIKNSEGQYRLSVGKLSGIDFMETDDLSWCGPVKCIKAWSWIKL